MIPQIRTSIKLICFVLICFVLICFILTCFFSGLFSDRTPTGFKKVRDVLTSTRCWRAEQSLDVKIPFLKSVFADFFTMILAQRLVNLTEFASKSDSRSIIHRIYDAFADVLFSEIRISFDAFFDADEAIFRGFLVRVCFDQEIEEILPRRRRCGFSRDGGFRCNCTHP